MRLPSQRAEQSTRTNQHSAASPTTPSRRSDCQSAEIAARRDYNSPSDDRVARDRISAEHPRRADRDDGPHHPAPAARGTRHPGRAPPRPRTGRSTAPTTPRNTAICGNGRWRWIRYAAIASCPPSAVRPRAASPASPSRSGCAALPDRGSRRRLRSRSDEQRSPRRAAGSARRAERRRSGSRNTSPSRARAPATASRAGESLGSGIASAARCHARNLDLSRPGIVTAYRSRTAAVLDSARGHR